MSDAVRKRKDEASAIRKQLKQNDGSKKEHQSVAAKPQKDHGIRSAVYKLSEKNYGSFVRARTASLVEFYAPW